MAIADTLVRTRLRFVPLALILVALLLPTALTAPVSAEERISFHFAKIRTYIDQNVPRQHQDAFRARVDAAENALLLPAVQSVREAARRNDCAAVHIVSGLRQYNRTLSKRLGNDYDPTAIDDELDRLLVALGPSECSAPS